MNVRSFRPAYFFKRLDQMWFAKAHPDAPWLAKSAILLLDSYLKPGDIGFEWGSGRSTLWFAQRVAHLYSVEDNRDWYEDAGSREADAEGDLSLYSLRLHGCGRTREPRLRQRGENDPG
jgi:hypothetical protein